jgi:hypothetical protein
MTRSRAGRFLCRTIVALQLVFDCTQASAQNTDPFPTPESKKGLQVQMIDDALALGIKHAALNCDLTALHEFAPDDSAPRWTVAGKDYRFNARRVAALDQQVTALSSRGVVVYLILLAYESGDPARDKIALHPGYDHGAKTNRMGAFNTVSDEGRAHFRAAIEFLAHRYSGTEPTHGRVWGYIVGNEVNSHWWWYNLGRASLETVASEYEHAVRLVHEAVRGASAHARVYLSFEHHWGIRYPPGAPDQSVPGRDLLDTFARLARERGDFDWHVAYHPYPENLGDCRFWNDRSATPDENTKRITFKNLEVLPRYLARAELQFGGAPRRIILSEQGFHSGEGADGERDQAAAFAAAWMKVARLELIDAFIYHRHVDHAYEGLNFGLWTHRPESISTPERRKQIYEVFRHADMPDREAAFAFALPIVGAPSWDEWLAHLRQPR